jgi:murein DD-endopeptidase MepM/ murein hydrolase activator NlpD
MRTSLLALSALALTSAACDYPTAGSGGGTAPTPGGGATGPSDPAAPPDEPAPAAAEQIPEEAVPVPSGPVEPPAPPTPDPAFPHEPAGALQPGTGSGYADRTVWSELMCFPLEEVGWLNSQVWRKGGGMGPPGGQCDSSNYGFPWRDNFCESRSRTNPVCGAGQGHQGQDIRPKTCVKNVHWAVAAEPGVITDIGSYSVTLTASDAPYRVYRYLHLNPTTLAVSEGSTVTRGQRIGHVSNAFGDTPTTIHLHFELRVSAATALPDGSILAAKAFVPPYSSLVKAYERKLRAGGGPGCG